MIQLVIYHLWILFCFHFIHDNEGLGIIEIILSLGCTIFLKNSLLRFALLGCFMAIVLLCGQMVVQTLEFGILSLI